MPHKAGAHDEILLLAVLDLGHDVKKKNFWRAIAKLIRTQGTTQC
jgi:hypothetical protein